MSEETLKQIIEDQNKQIAKLTTALNDILSILYFDNTNIITTKQYKAIIKDFRNEVKEE